MLGGAPAPPPAPAPYVGVGAGAHHDSSHSQRLPISTQQCLPALRNTTSSKSFQGEFPFIRSPGRIFTRGGVFPLTFPLTLLPSLLQDTGTCPKRRRETRPHVGILFSPTNRNNDYFDCIVSPQNIVAKTAAVTCNEHLLYL